MAQNPNEVNFGVFLGSGIDMTQVSQDLGSLKTQLDNGSLKGDAGVAGAPGATGAGGGFGLDTTPPMLSS